MSMVNTDDPSGEWVASGQANLDGTYAGVIEYTWDCGDGYAAQPQWSCSHRHATDVSADECAKLELRRKRNMWVPFAHPVDGRITHGSIGGGPGDRGYRGQVVVIYEYGDSLKCDVLWECDHEHSTEDEAQKCALNEIHVRGVQQQGSRLSMAHEPLVKYYKDYEANGAFAISTTATDPEEFLREAGMELPAVLRLLDGDQEFTAMSVLPQICELWAKLKGYKAEHVHEERRLVIGHPTPERAMSYLNGTRSAGVLREAAAVVDRSEPDPS